MSARFASDTNFDSLGNLLVALGAQIAGSDSVNDLLKIADAAYTYQKVMPLVGLATTGLLSVTPTADTAGWGKQTFATTALTAGIRKGMIAYSSNPASLAGIQEGALVTDVTGTAAGNGTITLNMTHQGPIAANAIALSWPAAPNYVALGTGAVGDQLKALVVTVFDPNHSQVIVKDGAAAHTVDSTITTSGNPSTLTMMAVNANLGTANAYVGRVFGVTYSAAPSGYSSAITVRRKIIAHTAGSISYVFLDHPLPAVPANTSVCYIEPTSASEVVPNYYGGPALATNVPGAQMFVLPFGKRSVNGGWNISVDIGVHVDAIGTF